MINRVFLTLTLSLGLAMFANAQTPQPRHHSPSAQALAPTTATCTATQLMTSPARGVAPEPAGWQIVANGYDIWFQPDTLTKSAFPAGAILDMNADKQPIFGCTTGGHMLLQVLSPAAFGTVQVLTVMHRDNKGVWSVAFSSIVTNKGSIIFPNPGNTSAFQLGAVFAKATHFLTNGNRLTMLSQFGAVASDWRAYDINIGGANSFLFDFRGFPTSAFNQACVTNTNLWFAIQVGTLTQIFGVDANGKLSLVPDSEIPAVNAGTGSAITLTCYGTNAGVQVVSADGTSSASYILADTRQ